MMQLSFLPLYPFKSENCDEGHGYIYIEKGGCNLFASMCIGEQHANFVDKSRIAWLVHLGYGVGKDTQCTFHTQPGEHSGAKSMKKQWRTHSRKKKRNMWERVKENDMAA